MRGLLDGSFLKRTENVMVYGTPGAGKTHLLQVVGEELIRQGHHLWLTTSERLVRELLTAKHDLKLSKLMGI
jgi:DNA replication protein DnaC